MYAILVVRLFLSSRCVAQKVLYSTIIMVYFKQKTGRVKVVTLTHNHKIKDSNPNKNGMMKG